MKKLLMTLIVAFAFCGSMFAQAPWADFSDGPYASSTFVVAFIQIDGNYVEASDNWSDLEIGAYWLKADGTPEWRGYLGMDDWTEDGDPYPIVDGIAACYNNTGESINFMLYDYSTGTLYENCSIFRKGTPDEPLEIITGDYNYNELYFDYDEAVVLSFSMGESAGIDYVINPGQWYLISSPVGEVNPSQVNNMLDNSYDLYYFDQAQELEWINYKASPTEINDFDLTVGKGYLYANNGNGEDTYKLTFNNSAYEAESLEVMLQYSTENPGADMRGWNLIGNPFYAQATIGEEPFYRMVEGELLPETSTGAIEPMEGVFVKATEEGQSVTFEHFVNSKPSILALNLSSNSKVIDRTIVDFGEGKTMPKLQLNPNSSKLYISVEGQEYAIVRSESMGEIPVSFKAESNGTYNLSLSSQNVEFNYLHLIDNLTGANQDLLVNPTYSFEARTTDYANRFRLVFATGNDEDSFAFFSNGSLVINNEGNATLQVVDVTGRIIKCESINGSASVNIDAASGVYMVRLINGDNVKVQKVVK